MSPYFQRELPPYWRSEHGRVRHREVNRVLRGLTGPATVIALADTGHVFWHRRDGDRLGLLDEVGPTHGPRELEDLLRARYPNLRVRVVQRGGYSAGGNLPDRLLLRIARGLDRRDLFPLQVAAHRRRAQELRAYADYLLQLDPA